MLSSEPDTIRPLVLLVSSAPPVTLWPRSARSSPNRLCLSYIAARCSAVAVAQVLSSPGRRTAYVVMVVPLAGVESDTAMTVEDPGIRQPGPDGSAEATTAPASTPEFRGCRTFALGG